jgi:hypothetical protein
LKERLEEKNKNDEFKSIANDWLNVINKFGG